MGMGQNQTTKKPQVLVHVGVPFEYLFLTQTLCKGLSCLSHPGKWKKPGSSYANNAPVLQDPHDQLMHGHVDPFYDAMKGKTYRGYYDFIIERGGRTKDKYEYLAKYGPPPFLTDPPGWEDFEVKQKAF